MMTNPGFSGGVGAAWNPNLHPRVGGKFAPKGSASSSAGASRKPAGRRTAAAKPNGLGYSTAQWKQLQGLEALAKAGKKLDAHQKHELHVAHQKRLAAMAKAAKPKAPAKPKAKAVKKATPKKPAALRNPAKATPQKLGGHI
jgi:hypothetical protein